MKTQAKIRVMVLGGGYAGMIAAVRLAGKTRGAETEIIVVNGRDHFVERIRLHQSASGQQLATYSIPDLLKGSDVKFVQGWVQELRTHDNQVVITVGDGDSHALTYDYLIYALGSTVATGQVPGVDQHAHVLAGMSEAEALGNALRDVAARNGRVVIVGAGLTGIEVASEMAESYPAAHITLATRGNFGEGFSQRGADYVRQIFDQLKIEVLDNVDVTEVQPHTLLRSAGDPLPFDVCVWAGSFVPSPLARASGLPTNQLGQVSVDDHLRVEGYDNVYAIGDAAATGLRMACATAMPTGAYAADDLAARILGKSEPEPFRFGYLLQCVSLGRKRGLVQFVDQMDVPRERVATGWLGARIKETICSLTIWSLRIERRLPGAYWWWWPRAFELVDQGLQTRSKQGVLQHGPDSGNL